MCENLHLLNNKWKLYYHLIDNENWDIDSYVELASFNTLESIINHYKYIDEDICKKSMLFLMRNDIKPIWEDVENINGGCYSFKIQNKIIHNVWKNISYSLVSENFLKENPNIINGISISPKKFFCILKIWINDNKFSELKFTNENINNLEYIFKANNNK